MTSADGLRRAVRGLSEAAFRERFGTETACREALFAMRWREVFRKREVEKLAKAAIEPGSTVVSDGLSCWPAVEKAGCQHFPIVTDSGKRAASWAPFRRVSTTLGNVKTALAGTYHHVSPKHAQAYLTSFAYRFDRRFQLDSIVERLAWAAVHTASQPYRVVVADV